MFGVNGWEIILLALLAFFILGPERLPEYAAKLAQGIRRLRVMAEGARGQLRDQLGPEYDDIDWRQYDPRQYDPRRIVREALSEPLDDIINPLRDEIGSVRTATRGVGRTNRSAPPPDDAEAAAPGRERSASLDESAVEILDLPDLDQLDPEPAYRGWGLQTFDPERPTPYDSDAT
ncbi:MAG: Sec-independent protein translocase TatB [Dermatophilaceae bacterium]